MEYLISGQLLYHAILHGAEQTRESRGELNRINVFPVVDNDTGNNLAHTMQHILTNAALLDNVRPTLLEISRSALIGARGNSGAIFSQYLYGLYENSPEKPEITLSELSQYFHMAYSRAYEALETPVEGTIITLMRTWATSVAELKDREATLRDIFEEALRRVMLSLKDTTNTLQVLKELHIVDAGALGFYKFIEGFVRVITGQIQYVKKTAMTEVSKAEMSDVHALGKNASFPFRYCTEVLLEIDSRQTEALKSELKPLGDCLLMSASENLARVHLHTNEPWVVIRASAARGTILEHKVDDMVFENRMTAQDIGDVALITDSIADLPREYVLEHNIYQIPINIMIDGHSYEDKISVDGAFLYENLGSASSSQLNAAQAVAFLKPIMACYRSILILTVSSKMNGTYDRFREALKELDPNGIKATLIDTRTNSGAQGLLVRRAVEMLEAGISPKETADHLCILRERIQILISLPDIRPMVQSGRISEKIGKVLIFLGFRPLITIDREGRGRIKGAAFSKSGNRRLPLKTIGGTAIEAYVLVHGHDEQAAEEVLREMVNITGLEPIYVTPISAVVALFAGRSSVAVAYIEKERAKS